MNFNIVELHLLLTVSVWSKDLKQSCDCRGHQSPNTHAYRLLIFKEHLLIRHQHRDGIVTRFHCLVKHLANPLFAAVGDVADATNASQDSPPQQPNTVLI